MSTAIQQETLHFLRRFRGRRRGLLLLRAAFTFIAATLLILTGLAVTDASFLVPDLVRWTISLAGYTFALGIAWFTSLRHLLGLGDQRVLAQVIEKADPSLREGLISAVELADPTGEQASKYDSEDFRRRVQRDAAEQVRKIDLGSLLPYQRVARAGAFAILGVALCIALLFIPGMHFNSFFQRAALPLMDFARPSEIAIRVIEPLPTDRSVPEHDIVRLLIETSGPPVDRVMLEVVDAERGRTKTEMRRERNGRYSGEIAIEQSNVKFRVRAKNSITRYFTLTSLERPRVTSFAKTYVYPPYTRFAEKHVEESMGDVSAVEGTMVRLRLATNSVAEQSLEHAELQLEAVTTGHPNVSIPLVVSEDGRWTGELPITPEYNTYRVHLVAEPNSVTNPFHALYEIHSVVDQAPRIEMTAPRKARELYDDEILTLTAHGEDDFGLTRIAYAWRTDASDWQESDFPIEFNTRSSDASAGFDLARLMDPQARLLTLKLMAIDGKGNVSETFPLHFALRNRSRDGETNDWVDRKVNLAMQTERLAKQIRSVERRANQVRKAISKSSKNRTEQERLDLVEIADAAQRNKEQAERLRDQFKQAVQEAPSQTEEFLLMAAARVASQVEHQQLKPLAEQLRSAARDQPRRKGRREAAIRANEAAWNMEKMSQRLRSIAAADRAAEIADTAERLSRRQQQIAHASRKAQRNKTVTPAAMQSLRERHQFNQQAAVELRDHLLRLSEVIPNGEKHRPERLARELKQKAGEVEKRTREQQARLEEDVPHAKADRRATEDFANVAEQMRNDMVHAERQTEAIANTLAEQAAKAREELLHENLAATADLEQIKHAAEHVAHEHERSAHNQRNAQANAKRENAEIELQQRLEAAADQLRDNAALEERREQPDYRAAADQTLLASALEAIQAENEDRRDPSSMQDRSRARELADRLAATEQARDALEADAQARQLADSLGALAKDASIASKREKLRHQPNAWQEIHQRIEQLPQTLKEAGAEESAIEFAQQRKDSQQAKQLNQEMGRRNREQQNENATAQEMNTQLEQLRQDAEQQQNVVAKKAFAARAALAEWVPSIPERTEGLAKRYGEQSDQNRRAAERRADRKLPEQVDSISAREAAQQNAVTNQDLSELLDDLRRSANTRDLADQQQRELARDADDALAAMATEDAPALAQEALEQAASSADDAAIQASEMAEASKQQSRLSQKLNALAKQLANPDQGRDALREQESASEKAEEIAENFKRAEELAQMLEEALDQLDPARLPSSGKSNSQAATEKQQAAASRLTQALNAQSQAMADSRATGPATNPAPSAGQLSLAASPSNSPSTERAATPPQRGSDSDAKAYGELKELNVTAAELREWGQLPPKVAEAILESRREGVSPEYRAAIESYYQALGERARSTQ